MTTDVTIANGALELCEHTFRVTALDDGSPEQVNISLHWDITRRQVLRDTTYSFAKLFIELAAVVDIEAESIVTPDDLPYVYDLRTAAIGETNDCLKVLRLCDVPEGKQKWQMSNGYLHTIHEAPLTIEIVRDMTDYSLWEPDAITDFQILLAHKIAPRWAKSQNRADILEKRYKDRIAMAGATEGAEGGDNLQDTRADVDWRDVVTPRLSYPGQGIY